MRRRTLVLGVVLLAFGALILLRPLFPSESRDVDSMSGGGFEPEASIRLEVDGTEAEPPADAEARGLVGMEDALPERGPATVAVLGPSGVPLPGVQVGLQVGERRGRRVTTETDARGVCVFDDVPYEKEARCVLVIEARSMERLPPNLVVPPIRDLVVAEPIRRPDHVCRPGAGFPIEVRLVEATTGRKRGDPVPVHPRFHGASAGQVLAVAPDRHAPLRLGKIDPEDGWIRLDAIYELVVPPRTKRIDVRLPLRPEAKVQLAFDASIPDEARRDAELIVYVDGSHVEAATATFDGFGRAHLHGVPFVPGGRIEIRGPMLTGGLTFGGDPDDDHIVAVNPVVDDVGVSEEEEELEEEIDVDLDAGTSTVVLRVEDPDGKAVPHALVYFGGTELVDPQAADRNGVCRLEHVGAGEQEFVVWGAGAPGRLTVRAPERGVVEDTIRGLRGATIRIQALSGDGIPAAFARVYVQQVSGLKHADLRPDGTLLADPFLDHRGRRVLHEVEPGTVRLTVWSGNRSSEFEIEVEDGRSYGAILKLR